uniref:Gypsy retrotransposon integrase-like protein 1 n=1 Tax=Astyanax mexicanus TaxID=7994 RepID=A0A3B1IW77_ASTMX
MLKKDIYNLVFDHLVTVGVLSVQPVVDTTCGVPSPLVESAVPEESTSPAELVDSSDGPETTVVVPVVETEVRNVLPHFDPVSPGYTESPQSLAEEPFKLRLARLEFDAKERAEVRKFEFELAVRKLELESERIIRLRELELKALEITSVQPKWMSSATPVPPVAVPSSGGSESPVVVPVVPHTSSCDVSKYISLVPVFREAEVDTYFSVFERLATTLAWPKDIWPVLLQCKLVGKAQEVCSALSLQDSLQYDVVKSAILHAYELVPEAYRQRFRNLRKQSAQTHVEFVREKGVLFDKWCSANKVNDFESLRELILLEEFKNCLPERVVTYLNERSAVSVSQAAVQADEFVLTHRQTFRSPVVKVESALGSSAKNSHGGGSPPRSFSAHECYYCHKVGHIAGDCLALKRKLERPNKPQTGGSAKSVGFVDCVCTDMSDCPMQCVDSSFKPFMSRGNVSLGHGGAAASVSILRDTGAAQSLILSSCLPFSAQSFCGAYAVCKGVGSGYIKAPLHTVDLSSDLVSGEFRLAVCDALPVDGVDLILGNDVAGGKVFPILEVLDTPTLESLVDDEVSVVFPACVVTRAQSRKLRDVVDLSDTFLVPGPENVSSLVSEHKVVSGDVAPVKLDESELSDCGISRAQLVKAQKADHTLHKYYSWVSELSEVSDKRVTYYLDDGLLMRCWKAVRNPELHTAYQIVMPIAYRKHVLRLAHDGPWSGHLGVTKTYSRVLKCFFWPSLKKDVAEYCRTCHTCQCVGKPNQKIPPAPLCPVPVMGEPFERVLVDCVGPLPKSKSGNQFLLTIMCTATRFPEAIPLRKITAPVIVRALVKFFSTFGLPREVQTDQGTNFMSKIFQQVMKMLNIKHVVSSPYHPESQGALERFHQSLKSALKRYCLETGKGWDEGVPLLLFAFREAVQESLSFSPADLVFGHTVRGPLKVLQESLMSDDGTSKKTKSVLEYVSTVRERLVKAWEIARESLQKSQGVMKDVHDKKAVQRDFNPGDQVLVLLPTSGSCLSARFSGPYLVGKRLSDTNYVIQTPDRKRGSRLCHVNMLKSYLPRDAVKAEVAPVSSVAVVGVSAELDLHNEGNDVQLHAPSEVAAKLSNSQALVDLPSNLTHLSSEQRNDVLCLVKDFSSLFNDVPTQTTVVQHDVKVTSSVPVKQHPYRTNVAKRAIMKSEVDYLVEHGFAKPSSSPWSSPCVLVPKPDGSHRFCTDYRKVNAVTVADSYPLPRMDDCIDNIGAAHFVTKLDLLKGYWQVPLTPEASDISAFVTPDDFLQYTVMPFGFKNAPATFQRLINIVLGDIKDCSAYLDDAVVYSADWDSHMKTLREVFCRLKQASLTLNLAKCVFAQATVTYLGVQVGRGQVRPVEAKVKAILEFPLPKTRRCLRRFLGMASYYRRFCRNFSAVVQPLTSLLSPSVNFKWSSACDHAFTSVKILLSDAPVLSAPDFSRPFLLEVDASAVGAGAVLLQEDADGILHPVCFYSHKFTSYQRNYSTIEKEALALLLAIQHFEVYVGSSSLPVVVFTDHNPLVFLSRMYNKNQRLMRWALLLQDYNLEIRHKKGMENVVADALSRAADSCEQ